MSGHIFFNSEQIRILCRTVIKYSHLSLSNLTHSLKLKVKQLLDIFHQIDGTDLHEEVYIFFLRESRDVKVKENTIISLFRGCELPYSEITKNPACLDACLISLQPMTSSKGWSRCSDI